MISVNAFNRMSLNIQPEQETQAIEQQMNTKRW